jgi:hypothetical protein
MKKIMLVLFLMVQMLVFAPKVNAVSFSTSISGASTINKGDTFTITISVSTGANKLYSFESVLTYDHSKINFVSSKCFLPGCGGVTVGSAYLNLDSITSKSGNYAMLSLTFQALPAFASGQSSTISISGVMGSIGSSDIDGSGSSRNITVAYPKSTNNNLSSLKIDGTTVPGFSASTLSYDLGNTDKTSIAINATLADAKANLSGTGTKNLAYGLNAFPIVVTAENGSVKTYTLNITRNDPRSSNNFLSAITLSSGTITFGKETGSYVVEVENNVTSITVGATVEDPKSTFVGNGTFDLKVYSNVLAVTVTAENQTTRTYTLDVVRKDELGFSRELSRDNALATLTLEGIDFGFAPDTTQYVLSVDTLVAALNVAAIVRDAKAKADYAAIANLELGQNVINIKVTAENGENRVYTLFVYRKSDAPYAPVDVVMETLSTSASSSIIMIPGISGIVSKEILDKAAEMGKQLIIEKTDDLGRVVYVWTFVGNPADTRINVDTNLSFTTPDNDKIRALSNYADGLILNFAHTGTIPAGTTVKIYVGGKFEDGMKLKLYLYDKDKSKLSIEVKEVEVRKGFVELSMAHASEYFLTRSDIKDMKVYSLYFVAMVVEAGLVLSLFAYLILRRKRKAS